MTTINLNHIYKEVYDYVKGQHYIFEKDLLDQIETLNEKKDILEIHATESNAIKLEKNINGEELGEENFLNEESFNQAQNIFFKLILCLLSLYLTISFENSESIRNAIKLNINNSIRIEFLRKNHEEFSNEIFLNLFHILNINYLEKIFQSNSLLFLNISNIFVEELSALENTYKILIEEKRIKDLKQSEILNNAKNANNVTNIMNNFLNEDTKDLFISEKILEEFKILKSLYKKNSLFSLELLHKEILDFILLISSSSNKIDQTLKCFTKLVLNNFNFYNFFNYMLCYLCQQILQIENNNTEHQTAKISKNLLLSILKELLNQITCIYQYDLEDFLNENYNKYTNLNFLNSIFSLKDKFKNIILDLFIIHLNLYIFLLESNNMEALNILMNLWKKHAGLSIINYNNTLDSMDYLSFILYKTSWNLKASTNKLKVNNEISRFLSQIINNNNLIKLHNKIKIKHEFIYKNLFDLLYFKYAEEINIIVLYNLLMKNMAYILVYINTLFPNFYFKSINDMLIKTYICNVTQGELHERILNLINLYKFKISTESVESYNFNLMNSFSNERFSYYQYINILNSAYFFFRGDCNLFNDFNNKYLDNFFLTYNSIDNFFSILNNLDAKYNNIFLFYFILEKKQDQINILKSFTNYLFKLNYFQLYMDIKTILNIDDMNSFIFNEINKIYKAIDFMISSQ
jgi:hypothetical protein